MFATEPADEVNDTTEDKGSEYGQTQIAHGLGILEQGLRASRGKRNGREKRSAGAWGRAFTRLAGCC